jgi:hypothetical protein
MVLLVMVIWAHIKVYLEELEVHVGHIFTTATKMDFEASFNALALWTLIPSFPGQTKNG